MKKPYPVFDFSKIIAEFSKVQQKENISFESSNISATISLSDDEILQLDDEAIIQALNDNVIGEDGINIEDIDQLDELSDDALRTKVINMVNGSRERCMNVSGNTLDIFSVDQLTSLGRIHSVYLSMEKFQVADLVSGLVYKVEAHVPLKMDSSHIFHASAKFKKNRFEITNDHPNDVLIDYQDAHPILFDSSEISNWVDGSIFIQITSEFSNAPNAKQKIEWTGTGMLETRAIITSPNLSWTGKVAIWNSDKNSRKKLLGNLLLTIKLVSDFIPPLSQSAPQKKTEELFVVPVSRIVNTPQSLYLFLNFSTIRSQKLVDYCSTGSVLTYLSIRIPSLPEAIDTPPILFNDYSVENQTQNSSVNVKHSFTLPFIPQTLGKDQLKLIIEVWHVISSYEFKSERNAENGPSLLGIVKLPFAYLLALLENPANVYPLIIPEAEYSVVDLFSGFTVGWLSATIAVGFFSQVSEMKSSFSKDPTQNRIIERCSNVDTGIQTSHQDISEAKSLIEPKTYIDENPIQEKAPIHISAEVDRAEYSNSSETIVSLTIHQVCGLKTLWNNITKSENVNLPSNFNSFLKLVFLPETGDILAEGDFDSSVVTDIVYDDFHYSSDTCVEMTIVGLGSEFIKWARTGGAARGEVLCRIDNRSTFEMGYFDVPLLPLLENPDGIKGKWVGVFPCRKQHEKHGTPSAFVQVSLFFKSGFDLGSLPGSISSLSTQYYFQISCRLKELHFSKGWIGSYDKLKASWILPKIKNGQLVFEEFASPYWQFESISTGCEIGHKVEFEIDCDSSLLDYFKSNNLELKFWCSSKQDSPRLLGLAFLSINSILPNKNSRGKFVDGALQKRKYDVINPSDDVVCGAQAIVELSCIRKRKITESSADQKSNFWKEPKSENNFSKEITNIRPMVVEDSHIMLEIKRIKSSKLDIDRMLQFAIDWPNQKSSVIESLTIFSDQFSPNDMPGSKVKLILPVPSSSHKLDCITLKLLASTTCLGQVVVSISVLYLGLDDINGWYPINSNSGECLGQLKIEASFSEPLKATFRKTIRSKQNNMSQTLKKAENLFLKGDDVKSDADTWKWNGSSWQHQSLPKADSSSRNNCNLRKSVHQTTLDELDNLQNMIRSIGSSPKTRVDSKDGNLFDYLFVQ